jgi:hypothetical protein
MVTLIREAAMAEFDGFACPTSNYYRLPNDWFDLWRQTRQSLATGDRPARIIAPLKIMEYVIKYTWGYSNFETAVRLSRSDLRQGRRGKRGQRLDAGTGLASEATLSRGIELALGLGMLEQQEHNTDAARQERFYLPRLRPIIEEEETPEAETFSGFYRPEANYFAVPHAWTNLSARINSEVLILSLEYFFRHTWGWQNEERAIRWLEVEEIVKGRRYRSVERRGQRYDHGIGYTIRHVRDALDEGAERELLVWRDREEGGKEYALRMHWMQEVSPAGYFDPDETGETELTLAISGRSAAVVLSNEKTVGGWEKSVEGAEKTVEGWEKSVEGQEKLVGLIEKGVGAAEKNVGRTCQDTFQDTDTQTLQPNTPPTTPPTAQAVVVPNDQESISIFFCPASENGEQDMSRCLTFEDASQVILTEPGTWYWSEADLAQPKVGDSAEIFTSAEIAVQIALDHRLFGQDYAIVEEGDERRHLLMVEAVREQLAKKLTSQLMTFVN